MRRVGEPAIKIDNRHEVGGRIEPPTLTRVLEIKKEYKKNEKMINPESKHGGSNNRDTKLI